MEKHYKTQDMWRIKETMEHSMKEMKECIDLYQQKGEILVNDSL